MEKPAPLAVTMRKALFVPLLHSAQERTADVFPVVFFRIIQSVLQSAAFFAT